MTEGRATSRQTTPPLPRRTRVTALLSLLLFLLVTQLHGSHAHGAALELAGGTAHVSAAGSLSVDAPEAADLCAVCIALHTARPQSAFAALPPADATVTPAEATYRFQPDRGWHAPLSCRPPPATA